MTKVTSVLRLNYKSLPLTLDFHERQITACIFPENKEASSYNLILYGIGNNRYFVSYVARPAGMVSVSNLIFTFSFLFMPVTKSFG